MARKIRSSLQSRDTTCGNKILCFKWIQLVTCAEMPSMKCWHAHQWRLCGNVGFFLRSITSWPTNPFSQSYTVKEPTLSLVSLSKAWSGTNIKFPLFQLTLWRPIRKYPLIFSRTRGIVSSINEGVLLCRAHNKSLCVYPFYPTIAKDLESKDMIWYYRIWPNHWKVKALESSCLNQQLGKGSCWMKWSCLMKSPFIAWQKYP